MDYVHPFLSLQLQHLSAIALIYMAENLYDTIKSIIAFNKEKEKEKKLL